jgi:hypothetical protein
MNVLLCKSEHTLKYFICLIKGKLERNKKKKTTPLVRWLHKQLTVDAIHFCSKCQGHFWYLRILAYIPSSKTRALRECVIHDMVVITSRPCHRIPSTSYPSGCLRSLWAPMVELAATTTQKAAANLSFNSLLAAKQL